MTDEQYFQKQFDRSAQAEIDFEIEIEETISQIKDDYLKNDLFIQAILDEIRQGKITKTQAKYRVQKEYTQKYCYYVFQRQNGDDDYYHITQDDYFAIIDAENTSNSPFELLRNKSILSILDGDTNFGELSLEGSSEPVTISLPYQKGYEICELSNKFGLPVTYGSGGGNQSRWAILDDLIKFCIENNRVSDLLGHLFSKRQFVDKLKGNSPVVIEEAHKKIVETIISKINGVLYFGGNELVVIGNRFEIRKLDDTVSIAAPTVKSIDRIYINDLSDGAMNDVKEGNYDSAITKSRTLLEEVFFYVIEKKEKAPSDSGDIGKLYSQVKELYNMHQNKEVDKRINMLLSGFEKIITSIA